MSFDYTLGNNPNHVPPSVVDLVANFVKSFGNLSESIPVPVSFMLTTISSLLLLSFLSTITIMLPSSVNLIALFNKLQII